MSALLIPISIIYPGDKSWCFLGFIIIKLLLLLLFIIIIIIIIIIIKLEPPPRGFQCLLIVLLSFLF